MPSAICPLCSRQLKYPAREAGRQIACPACNGQMRLPEEGQPDRRLAFEDDPPTPRRRERPVCPAPGRPTFLEASRDVLLVMALAYYLFVHAVGELLVILNHMQRY